MSEEDEEKRVHLVSEMLSLDRQYAEGEIDEKTYSERRKNLQKDLSEIETQKQEAKSSRSNEERLKEYMKEGIQTLLRRLLDEKPPRLTPVYDFNFVTGYRYPEAEESLMENPIKTVETLRYLSSLKILVPRFFDKLYYCPKCDSPVIQLRFLCNECNSRNLQWVQGIEHLYCGYIGLEDEFIVGDKFKCPKCGKELRQIGVDYSKLGHWYKCNECGKLSNKPLMKILCINCGSFSVQDELQDKNVYSYILNDELKQEIVETVISFKPLIVFLNEIGFKVETPGLRWGVSGVEHRFDIAATKVSNNVRKTLVLKVLISDMPIKPEAILEFYMKAFDVKADIIVIVAIPSLQEGAKIAAENYGIHFAEGEKIQSALERLKELEIWS